MKEDILNIISEIRGAYQTGGVKYFFHNLSCRLRNWNFSERKTRIQKIAYSFGVFLLCPTGRFYKLAIKQGWFHRALDFQQWQFHPLPWIANDAKKRYNEKF